MPLWSPEPITLCALFSGLARLTPKVQVLLDFLGEYIEIRGFTKCPRRDCLLIQRSRQRLGPNARGIYRMTGNPHLTRSSSDSDRSGGVSQRVIDGLPTIRAEFTSVLSSHRPNSPHNPADYTLHSCAVNRTDNPPKNPRRNMLGASKVTKKMH